MIEETGRIVAVETDSVWVETIRQSSCGHCSANKGSENDSPANTTSQGCGQSLLARWGGHTAYLRVVLQDRDPGGYRINDRVRVGIPEDILAKGALFVYMTPLLLMLFGAWGGHVGWQAEATSVLGGILGLAIGSCVVRLHAHRHRNDARLQPVLIDVFNTAPAAMTEGNVATIVETTAKTTGGEEQPLRFAPPRASINKSQSEVN